MPLFDFFKKRMPEPEFRPAPSLAQLCYDIAYFILPDYAYQDLDRLREIAAQENRGGPFFYFMASKRRELQPDPEDARKFRWHSGTFPDDSTHLTLQYPVPPPVSLNLEEMVLAPYFSSIVETTDGGVGYFILGQSPTGKTTLRVVMPNGTNANLGPGPEPTLEAFLARIIPENGEGFKVIAATGPPR